MKKHQVDYARAQAHARATAQLQCMALLLFVLAALRGLGARFVVKPRPLIGAECFICCGNMEVGQW